MDEIKDTKQVSGGDDNQKPPKNLANASLFSHLGISDKNFIFQYKKTEKILAALYLVTNFLSQQEPLRWEVRELGLNLLSSVMSLKDALPSLKDELCTSIKTMVLEMISLLEIAHFAGFVSAMNFNILKQELVMLLDSVAITKQSLESFLIPNNFFADETSVSGSLVVPHEQQTSSSYSLKDKKSYQQDPYLDKRQIKQKSPLYKENTSKKVYGSVLIKKTSRQTIIVDLVKKKKEIMIKDVSSVIKNCSEKTLQRELLSMVEQGILRKEGERRWSKYSLA